MASALKNFSRVVNTIFGITGLILVRKSTIERLTRNSNAFIPYIARNRFIDKYKFDFVIANEVGKSWYDSSTQQYLPERGWCLSKILPGMTIVDCGAHHGMMTTIFALATGPKGKVIAYEALPTNADVIVNNAKLNGLANVTVRGVGVGGTAGKFAVANNESNTIVVSNTSGDGENIIEIVRLDDDLHDGLKVDFLKVDVEGHEVEALRGMQRIIARKPIIDLEIHNFLFKDRNASLRQIAAMLDGYEFSVLGEILDNSIMKDFGRVFPIDFLEGFENPHVLCTPISDALR
jgi:FkbM family methyltransferase